MCYMKIDIDIWGSDKKGSGSGQVFIYASPADLRKIPPSREARTLPDRAQKSKAEMSDHT